MYRSAMILAAITIAACSSNDPAPATTVDAGPAGGAVSGALDSHCAESDGGKRKQATDPATCNLTAPEDAGAVDAAADASSGDDAGGDTGGSDFGDTLFNDEGDDDDCKYHVKWSATAIRENTDVTFTVTATTTVDGKPATGAKPRLEIFLNETHPAPNVKGTVATETSPGVYTVGPSRFDASGRWTVRFHFYEDCTDFSEESPHGHAAFYVDVP